MGSRKFQLLSIFLLISFVIVEFSFAEELHPIVSIKHGKVRGIKTKNHYEFRRIPFAKPPLGPLRFKVGDLNLASHTLIRTNCWN